MFESNERASAPGDTRSEQSPYDRLTSLREAVITRYPELAAVSINILDATDRAKPEYSGAAFEVTRERGVKILMALADPEHAKRLMEMRPVAIALVAERLSLQPAEITPELLEAVVSLHEYGHAKDFLLNYKVDESGKPRPDDEAILDWNTHYDASLMSLPIPGLDPSDLRTEVTACGGVTGFFDRHPELWPADARPMPTEEELYREQEVAYRNLPHEKYADDFAYDTLSQKDVH